MGLAVGGFVGTTLCFGFACVALGFCFGLDLAAPVVPFCFQVGPRADFALAFAATARAFVGFDVFGFGPARS